MSDAEIFIHIRPEVQPLLLELGQVLGLSENHDSLINSIIRYSHRKLVLGAEDITAFSDTPIPFFS